MIQTVYIIGTAVTVYVLCYMVDFLWKLLVLAPEYIYGEQNLALVARGAEIRDLRTKLAPQITPLEQSRRDRVAEKLQSAPPEDLFVLKHVLTHGETRPAHIRSADFSQEAVNAAIQRACYQSNLLKPTGTAMGWPLTVVINPELMDALSFHLLTRPDGLEGGAPST